MKYLKTNEELNQEVANLSISDYSNNSHTSTQDERFYNVSNLDDKIKGVWAIFRVSFGQKFYFSSVWKKDLHWSKGKNKYSDESTLKLTKDFATEVGLANKEIYVDFIGISNDKGVQVIL